VCYTTLYCIILQYSVLHYIILYYITVQYSVLQYTAYNTSSTLWMEATVSSEMFKMTTSLYNVTFYTTEVPIAYVFASKTQ
jgi:hypothetical protein